MNEHVRMAVEQIFVACLERLKQADQYPKFKIQSDYSPKMRTDSFVDIHQVSTEEWLYQDSEILKTLESFDFPSELDEFISDLRPRPHHLPQIGFDWRDINRRHLLAHIAISMIGPYIAWTRSYDVYEIEKTAVLGFFFQGLRDESTNHVAIIAPLNGLTSDVDEFRIAENIRVRRMTADELRVAIRRSAVPQFIYPVMEDTDLVMKHHQYALVIDSKTDRDAVQTSDYRTEEEYMKVAEELTQAAMLLAGGSASTSRILTSHLSHGPLRRLSLGGGAYSRLKLEGLRPTNVNDTELPELLELFKKVGLTFRGGRRVGGLPIAITRLTGASRRKSTVDSLTDLVIAAEAIFGDSTPGEITFKIGIRAALISKKLVYLNLEPSLIKKFISHVYQQRSKVVHGKTPDSLRRINGEPTSNLKDLIDDLSPFLRATLRYILLNTGHATTGVPTPPAWDELLNEFLDQK